MYYNMDADKEDNKDVKAYEVIRERCQERFLKNGHFCTIPCAKVDRINVKLQKDKKKAICLYWKQILTNLCIVDDRDVIAINFFRSQLAVDVEKLRHIKKYLYVIHPYSKLIKYWQNFMIFVLIVHVFHFPLVLTFYYDCLFFYNSTFTIFIECCSLVDIILKFKTGYVKKEDNYVCLNKKEIALRYLKTIFVLDFLAWIPIQVIITNIYSVELLATADLFILILKSRRLFILIRYIQNTLSRFSISLLTNRVLVLSFLGIYYLHWLNAFQYAYTFLVEGGYTPRDSRHISWMTHFDLWNADPTKRYFCGLFRIVLLVTFQALNKDSSNTIEDLIFTSFIWTMSLIFTVATISIIVFTVIGKEYTKARYYSFQNQLNLFMERKELSQELKMKLVLYFKIRYSNCLISEDKVLESMTTGLQQEVTLHSFRRLINNIPFLMHLPDDTLIEVVRSMVSQIALPNEVICYAGPLAQYIYFIQKGTVAIYSENGFEVSHLHDGEYFGEIALIGGPRFRAMNVIAVTACELLRLDSASFSNMLVRHPELLRDLIRIAADRMKTLNDTDKLNDRIGRSKKNSADSQ